MQSAPVKPTPIAVYDLPITRVVNDFEEFPGPDPLRSTPLQVRARVSGYINDPVYFKDGSMVSKEDKLFEIDPPDVQGGPGPGQGYGRAV